MLDILERLAQQQGYSYHRMDGGTPVAARGRLMDDFNGDPARFLFLLTTKVFFLLCCSLPGAARLVMMLLFAATRPPSDTHKPLTTTQKKTQNKKGRRPGRQPDGRRPRAAVRPRLEPRHRRAGGHIVLFSVRVCGCVVRAGFLVRLRRSSSYSFEMIGPPPPNQPHPTHNTQHV